MSDKSSITKAIHAVVHGRVQGVGFRYWARSTAAGLKLTGWVRNLDDGNVELFFQGKPEYVNRFGSLLGHGPPGAYVTQVDSRPVTPRESYDRFSISV